MKMIFIVLLLCSLQLPAQEKISTASGNDLRSCIITSAKESYAPGETPKITVEIKNNSDQPVYLVKALDGSECKWRFPYAYFTISKIGDTSYKPMRYGRCGNMDELMPSDFVEVQPGSTFNPYQRLFPHDQKENIYSYDFQLLDKTNFRTSGKYIITFFYSTKEAELSGWKGRFSRKLTDEENKKIAGLFPKILHEELVSNELVIEIK